jgi:hypothetical protein
MITRSSSGEVTIRQPGRCLQIFVYLALTNPFWLVALVGTGMLIWLHRPAGLACLTVLVLTVAWGCHRAIGMHVRFDESGVTVRNFWRTRRLSWDEVSHFTDGGKDWWALKVVRRSGRPIEATGTTSGAKSIVSTGVLDVIGQVAERYHVRAELGGRTLIERIAARGQGSDAASVTAPGAGLIDPAGLAESLAGPQQGADAELDGYGNRADAQPPSRAIVGLSLACLVCAICSIGLGITDLIAYGILAGYLVVVGMASGFVAALLGGIIWLGMAAPNAAKGRQTEVVRRICRAGQMLGILGAICLAIGSGNGSSL